MLQALPRNARRSPCSRARHPIRRRAEIGDWGADVRVAVLITAGKRHQRINESISPPQLLGFRFLLIGCKLRSDSQADNAPTFSEPEKGRAHGTAHSIGLQSSEVHDPTRAPPRRTAILDPLSGPDHSERRHIERQPTNHLGAFRSETALCLMNIWHSRWYETPSRYWHHDRPPSRYRSLSTKSASAFDVNKTACVTGAVRHLPTTGRARPPPFR